MKENFLCARYLFDDKIQENIKFATSVCLFIYINYLIIFEFNI